MKKKEFRLITKDGDVIHQPGEWPPPFAWKVIRQLLPQKPIPLGKGSRSMFRDGRGAYEITFLLIGVEVDKTGTWARYEEESRHPF